jgi:hypothetical protein
MNRFSVLRLSVLLFGMLLLGGLVATAQAQPVPPSTSLPAPTPSPVPVAPLVVMPVPLPPLGCVWASRVFSDGAAFCIGAGTQMVCKAGKWSPAASEACRDAAPVDAR